MALLHDNTLSPRDDRRIRGKLLRDVVPRESHSEWKAPKDRPDPVQMLEESNKGRIQHLIPIRYGRMLQTPFTFYRGRSSSYGTRFIKHAKLQSESTGLWRLPPDEFRCVRDA